MGVFLKVGNGEGNSWVPFRDLKVVEVILGYQRSIFESERGRSWFLGN